MNTRFNKNSSDRFKSKSEKTSTKKNFEKISKKSEELLNRYDKYFGKGTKENLLKIKKEYSYDKHIRINTTKTNIDEIITFLKKNRAIYCKTFLPNSIRIKKSFFNISSSLLSLTGKVYIQDLASQIPINCIDFEELKKLNRKIKILDCAASPGSKTTQLADLLTHSNIEYEIIALELEKKRLNKLMNNLQKQNMKNIKIVNCPAQKFISKEKFDLILLDAPCSGNLIGDKTWLNKREISGILDKAKLQREILANIHPLLEKNGTLIYSTCSLEVEENEDNVKWLLENSNLKPIETKIKFPFSTQTYKNIPGMRFMPYLSKTEGFFVAIFKK